MHTADLLHHRLSVSEEGCLLHLRGEVDFSVIAELRATLDAVDVRVGQPVRIDLADLTFIDLVGLQTLADFAERAHGAGCDVRVENASRLVRLLHEHVDAGALRLV